MLRRLFRLALFAALLLTAGVLAFAKLHRLGLAPHTRPEKMKKLPAPLFHAVSKAACQELRKAYGFFLASFREAAERLKAGRQGDDARQRAC